MTRYRLISAVLFASVICTLIVFNALNTYNFKITKIKWPFLFANSSQVQKTFPPTTTTRSIKTMNLKTKPKKTLKIKHNDARRTINLELHCPNRTILPGLCQKGWRLHDPPRCVMSVNAIGRLGNTMGQYATLYALARWNGRPAFMLPEMAKSLRRYFRVTMPTLDDSAVRCLDVKWSNVWLNDWMVDSYRTIEVAPQLPLKLTGYPCSWTFFDHLRDEIRREFRLHDHVEKKVQDTLRALLGNEPSATFVGVHVRRTDYVSLMAGVYRGVVADATFLSKAMAYFRSRYDDAIFVVASDDITWCQNNINASMGDVHFASADKVDDPGSDLALLSRCNHSIITIGTYGFWSAYLAGGETVHLINYTLPESPFMRVLHYEDTYLPDWISIPADLSVLQKTTLTSRATLTTKNAVFPITAPASSVSTRLQSPPTSLRRIRMTTPPS